MYLSRYHPYQCQLTNIEVNMAPLEEANVTLDLGSFATLYKTEDIIVNYSP